MKINKKTDTLMVLKDLSLLTFGIGIVFALVGIFMLITSSSVPLWFSIIFLGIGLLVIITAKMTTVTIDKSSSKLSLKKQGLLGTKIEEYGTNQIKELQLRQSIQYYTNRGGSRGQRLVTNLYFVLKENKEVLLTSGSISGVGMWGFFNSQKISNEEKIGQEISTFLSIPFQVYRPSTVGEMLSTVKGAIEEGMAKSKSEQPK
jgi:hypothetical protein